MKIHLKYNKIWLSSVLFSVSLLLLYLKLSNQYLEKLYENIEKNDKYILYNLNISSSIYYLRVKRYNTYQKMQYYQKGPGENGQSVTLTEDELKNLNDVMKKEAFNRPTSDRISFQRSLPDFRSAK